MPNRIRKVTMLSAAPGSGGRDSSHATQAAKRSDATAAAVVAAQRW
jgi:hypothetical protein